jgi:hypothetical protein
MIYLTFHGKSFSSSCLTISKYRSIKTFKYRIYKSSCSLFVNIFLLWTKFDLIRRKENTNLHILPIVHCIEKKIMRIFTTTWHSLRQFIPWTSNGYLSTLKIDINHSKWKSIHLKMIEKSKPFAASIFFFLAHRTTSNNNTNRLIFSTFTWCSCWTRLKIGFYSLLRF